MELRAEQLGKDTAQHRGMAASALREGAGHIGAGWLGNRMAFAADDLAREKRRYEREIDAPFIVIGRGRAWAVSEDEFRLRDLIASGSEPLSDVTWAHEAASLAVQLGFATDAEVADFYHAADAAKQAVQAWKDSGRAYQLEEDMKEAQKVRWRAWRTLRDMIRARLG